MTDIYTKAKRSSNMRRILGSDTRPERYLLSIVRQSLGSRMTIRTNDRKLPGRPDLVVPALHLVLFADGCFFHSCPLHGRLPKSNRGYWRRKLTNNTRRDRSVSRRLRASGYAVWRVWEHDLRGNRRRALAARLEKRLLRRMLTGRARL